MKILIITANAIGDSFISMAAINPLREKYPDAEFYFVLPEQAAVLDTGSEQNFTFVFVKKNYSSLIKTLIKLAAIKFDRAYSFIPGVFNSFMLSMIRSRVKAGQKNFVRNIRWDDRDCTLAFKGINYGVKEVKLQKYANYLSRISTVLGVTDNIEVPIEKYKPYTFEDSPAGIERVLIHYKSSVMERSIPMELLKALVEYLRSITNLDIVILGSKTDFESDDFSWLSDYSACCLVEPNLKDMIDAIRKSFYIGPDSFPLHLADAYNCHFIGLFSMTKPRSVLINSENSISFGVYSFEDIDKEDFIVRLNEFLVSNNLLELIRKEELSLT